MESYVLALGGLIGSAIKAWVTVEQPTLSKQSLIDIILGGAVGLLWTIWPPFDLPATASLVQRAAIVGITAYFSSDLLANLARRFMPASPPQEPPPGTAPRVPLARST